MFPSGWAGGNPGMPNNAFTSSLTADVALNNTALYFDGPTAVQGAGKLFFVSGTVTVFVGSTSAVFLVKLWDGTTVIASTVVSLTLSSPTLSISLCGMSINPTGNLRISVRESISASSKIVYNSSGLGKDSSISVVRLG